MAQVAKRKGKVDPLNEANYTAVSAMLAVTDVNKSYEFYQKALGFTGRGIMPGPDGKPMHAELKLRDSVLMLGPEFPTRNYLSARTIGNTPVTLYLYVEDVDKVLAQASKAGAQVLMPAADMFWGDRAATIADPDGNRWMLATHKTEPTPKEMEAAMKKQFSQQQG